MGGRGKGPKSVRSQGLFTLGYVKEKGGGGGEGAWAIGEGRRKRKKRRDSEQTKGRRENEISIH